MSKKKIIALCEEFAIGSVFSFAPEELQYGDVIEVLESGKLPDEASVWEKFENDDPTELANLIESYFNTFEYFAREVQKINERRD